MSNDSARRGLCGKRRAKEKDRKKEKGEPGERTNVPGQIIVESVVPAS